MDTRTLGTKVVEDGIAIIDRDSDNLDRIGVVELTDDTEFDIIDRIPLAKELVKRWNAVRILAEYTEGKNKVPAAMVRYILQTGELPSLKS